MSMNPRRSRRIFVGDVQGCCEELRRLLDRLRFDPAEDELHGVGDLVNRGPDSAGVLRLMREVSAGGVLGNHDLHLLRVAAGRITEKPSDTIADVLTAPDREELLAWLAARPLIRTWPDVILVHAGLHPKWRDPEVALAGRGPLDRDPYVEFVTHVRYCTPEGSRPRSDRPAPGPPFAPWFHFHPASPSERRIVVFGHWSARGLVFAPLLRGLDTGCVWGGSLTAWIAEEDRFFEVAASGTHARTRS
jgi:bis(5'-nucleosyl)-tetraphosphatase (symmetrical)